LNGISLILYPSQDHQPHAPQGDSQNTDSDAEGSDGEHRSIQQGFLCPACPNIVKFVTEELLRNHWSAFHNEDNIIFDASVPRERVCGVYVVKSCSAIAVCSARV
jgi:hypothetical protein